MSTDNLISQFNEKLQLISSNSDSKIILKVLRELPPLRKQLTDTVLIAIINKYYKNDDYQYQYLISSLDSMVEETNSTCSSQFTPETDLFIHLLIQLYLHDTNQLVKLESLNSKIIELLKSYNKRSLDYLRSKIWFYIQRTAELLNDKDKLVDLRHDLFISLRTATLKHDNETAASIITLLLRNYFLTNDVSLASNFVSKIEMPENCGNNLMARYYYYMSKLNVIQLNYSTALNYIILSIRKAPQSEYVKGFLLSASKLKIIIELLMGDIPSLIAFNNNPSLTAYMEITKSVKLGDLTLFNVTLEKYKDVFIKDDLYESIVRLRANVIKTGIRLISLCYKRITIKDICLKMNMDSELSTEYILNKLIKDHIIDATLDNGYLQSKEFLNVYDSQIPASEFNKRINAINSLKKSFVKEMVYSDLKKLNQSIANSNSNNNPDLDQEVGEFDADFDDFF